MGGGHKTCWGSFNMGALSFSHAEQLKGGCERFPAVKSVCVGERGGGHKKLYPDLRGGGGKKFSTCDFHIL